MISVYLSCRTNSSGASLFTSLICASSSWADCINIVELRAVTNIAILSDSAIGFTYLMLIIKLILSTSLVILETIYRLFFTLVLIKERLLLCLENSI